MSTTEDQRTAYIDGLRALAAILEQHPEVPLPYEGHHGELSWFLFGDGQRDRLAAIARAFPCKWEKRTWGKDDEHFELKGKLAGLKIAANARREQVCTRVVTGTEEREVEEVVEPAVTRKVVKQVEVVEWECQPLLAEPGRPAEVVHLPEPEPESCSACGATDTPLRDGRCNNRMLCAGRAAARDAETAKAGA